MTLLVSKPWNLKNQKYSFPIPWNIAPWSTWVSGKMFDILLEVPHGQALRRHGERRV